MTEADEKYVMQALRSDKMIAPAPDDPRQVMARYMETMADQLVHATVAKTRADDVIQIPDLVEVFALACAKVIVELKKNPGLAPELAGTALRTIIKNLKMERRVDTRPEYGTLDPA